MRPAHELSSAQRWALVNERLRAEQALATDEKRLTQLASLMASVDDFGWRAGLGLDDERVRAMWQELRQKLGRG